MGLQWLTFIVHLCTPAALAPKTNKQKREKEKKEEKKKCDEARRVE
jgi:hypothetical protein